VGYGEFLRRPVLKPVTRALRGTALLPYWAIRGVTSGTRELYPAGPPGKERGSIETRLIERLRFTGLPYRYFLCAPKHELALTRVGHTISARIERKLATVPNRLHRGAG